MLKLTSRTRIALLMLALTPPLGLIITPPARAQESPATTAGRQMRPLSNILSGLTQGGGASVVADSSVMSLTAPLPMEATTAENLERQITALVATLPKGTIWAKLYLPPPAKGRGYDGNTVAEYAMAQSKLVGPVGGETPPGIVEIFGQKISSDKAKEYIAGLNLQPVYLISNPNAKSAFGLMGDPSQWGAMTPEQRQKYAQDTASQLANMDPASRNALMQQNFLVFGQLMRQLPPDQRNGLFQGMGGPVRVQINTTGPDGATRDAIVIAPPPQP